MAAFAAVVLIGLVTILNQGDDTPPPATEPTPTTQAVQETTAAATPTTLPSETVATTVPIVLDPRADEALATATAFIEAMATNDFATAETHALDEVMHSLLGKFSKAFLVDEVAFKDALGWNIAVQGCTVTNPDPANTRLTCSYSHSTDISRASGVGPYAAVVHYTVKYAGDSYFGQTIEDTTVVQGQQDLVEYADLKVETFDPFMAWIEANHNDDLVTMWYDEAAPNPWLTRGPASLVRTRIDRSVASILRRVHSPTRRITTVQGPSRWPGGAQPRVWDGFLSRSVVSGQ